MLRYFTTHASEPTATPGRVAPGPRVAPRSPVPPTKASRDAGRAGNGTPAPRPRADRVAHARPSAYVLGSPEWWRHRLRSEGLSSHGSASADVTDRLGGGHRPEQADRRGPTLVAPPPPPSPPRGAPLPAIRQRHAGVAGPAEGTGRAATIAATGAPGVAGAGGPTGRTRAPSLASAPHLSIGELLREWRSNHLVAAVFAALLTAVAIVVWAPGHTVEPVTAPNLDAVPPEVARPDRAEGEAERRPRASGAAGAPAVEETRDASQAAGSNDSAVPGGEDASCGVAGCPGDASPATELARRIDAARRRNGLPALVDDPDLARVAHKHLEEMVAERDLFHTANEVLGRRVTNWDILAESIGVGPSVASLMEAFLGSDIDRRNMLDPAFQHVGVAALQQGQRLWVTVLFSDSRNPGTTLGRG
jgi:uncharacterized protein YkwD